MKEKSIKCDAKIAAVDPYKYCDITFTDSEGNDLMTIDRTNRTITVAEGVDVDEAAKEIIEIIEKEMQGTKL